MRRVRSPTGRCRNEENDDEHILELREKPTPGRHRPFGGELVGPEPLAASPCVIFRETAPQVGLQCRYEVVDVPAVRNTQIRRLVGDGRHIS